MTHLEPIGLALALALLVGTAGCSPDRLRAVELEPGSLRDGLLAHWAFDDATGTTARDDSGYGRDGALSGGKWLLDGQFAGALHFADGEFVSVPRFPGATLEFSVSAWVRLADGSQAAVTGDWTTIVSTENSGGWEVNVDHRSKPELGLHFGFWKGPGSGDYEGAECPGLSYGVWSQVAGVMDSATSTYRVYRDGKLCHSTATDHRILPGSDTLTIGEWPYKGRYLNGDVDEIAVWGRALVPEEIALLAAIAVPPAD